jgi:geranylgeranyl diphosphate synthase type II
MVEEALESALPPAGVLPDPLHAAMRYSVFSGGKRVRPMLVLATAEALGAAPTVAMPAACAVELIHTYSLIHDDLPSMDDSPTRRDRPSCHVVFGEAIAVLAGDALHALAFELMARNAGVAGQAAAIRVIAEVAEAIGTQGMVGGQVLDLLAEDRPALCIHGRWPSDPREGVQQIHRWKTAALIRACVRSGAILAGAGQDDLDAVTGYGEHLGLAFQIVDDLLDEAGDSGIPAGLQSGNGRGTKLTFPAAFGIEASRSIARQHTGRAVAALAGWGLRAEVLCEMAVALLERES